MLEREERKGGGEEREEKRICSFFTKDINKCRRNDSTRKASFITASGKDHQWMLKVLGE